MGKPGAQASPARPYKDPGPQAPCGPCTPSILGAGAGLLSILSTSPHLTGVSMASQPEDPAAHCARRQRCPGGSPWNSPLHQGAHPPPLAPPRPAAPFSLAFHTTADRVSIKIHDSSRIPGQWPPGRPTQGGASEPARPRARLLPPPSSPSSPDSLKGGETGVELRKQKSNLSPGRVPFLL